MGRHTRPIAQRIKPNAVDARGTRYQLNDAGFILKPAKADLPAKICPRKTNYPRKDALRAQIKAWVHLPSAEQVRQRCLLCRGGRHNPKNEACVRLSKTAKSSAKRTTLYSFPSGQPLPGAWTRTRILVPARYKSGACTFAWRAE